MTRARPPSEGRMSDETDTVVQHAAREAKACDACLDAVLAVAREAHRVEAFEEAASMVEEAFRTYHGIAAAIRRLK